MKALIALKYLCVTIVISIVAEIAILLLGHWLRVRIPAGITIGLLIGVIAWFANKLHKEIHSN